MLVFPIPKMEKLLPELKAATHREVYPIPAFRFHEGECSGAERPDFDDSAWADFPVGGFWGGYDVTAWFRARVEVPRHLRGQKLALRFLVGPRDGGDSTAEALLYVNGEALQGIDIWHEAAWLPPEHIQDGHVHVALHAWSGVLGVPDRRHFRVAQLIWLDEATERFYHLAHTLVAAIKVLAEGDLRRVRLLDSVNQAFHRLDFTQPRSEGFYASVADAEHFLRQAVEALQGIEELKPTVVGIGHAHIDLAWLWRLAHSRQKAGRTFATVLHLMRQYPEYRFLHSSPQLYKFLQEDFPDLYDRVKKGIAAGTWEISGGMWVEADVNLPNGESLVRQFLLGKRFIRDTFDVETCVLWLPDVFGYSASLPQIIRKCGMTSFMTTKLSWNQFNRFPYDTFRWRGIDGTEVLTHFVTTPDVGGTIYTYNGTLAPAEVVGLWENYRQKEANDELLLLFGWGDGGGGPTQEMLEAARVQRDLPGIPRVELGKAEPYFERLAARVAARALPTWDGELYFEYHRGTYTSQAQTKRANRKAEVLYHNAEWLSALADALTGQSRYPRERLREGWERLLLNQFHDILPGSSIREVYEDSAADYTHIQAIGVAAVDEAQQRLSPQLAAGPGVVVFNPLSWQRDGLVALPLQPQWEGHTLLDADGLPAPSQAVKEDGERRLLVRVRDVPALGYRVYPLVAAAPVAAAPITITPTQLENRYYHIALNKQGQFVSLWDKTHGREVLAPSGRGNVFQAFEDKPLAFDAWDIDLYYQEKMREVRDLVEAEVEESGPLRGVLRLRWRFYESTITQWLTLYADGPRIDFRTEIDWREQQVLLKVAFPVAIRATRATYEIQFGTIERPTHWNTPWDYARFESVGHRWVDLSEGNYGVSLLNDCKYGHDIKDNMLRLTLIKSAIRPDALADKGLHRFTYSLLPHGGGWRDGGTVQQGYALNYPLLTHALPAEGTGTLPAQASFATVESDAVILETIKQAEEGDGWIVRVYEWKQDRHAQVVVRFAWPLRRAVACNLIEEDEEPIEADGDCLRFAIAPYEIKTFKVWF